MESRKAQIGRIGEEAACGYLLEHGHTILERNWRSGHLEVDIISLDCAGVHFIEVKCRVAPVSADPLDSVGWRKQRNISKAAQKYMAVHGKELGDPEISLDVASVVLDGGAVTMDLIQGAYIPVHM